MHIGGIPSLDKLLPHSLLSQSWLWKRPVDQVSNEELLAFLRIWKEEGRLNEARRNVDSLLHTTYKAMMRGEIDLAPYAAFCEPNPTFTVADLCDMLEPLSTVRKRAAIFALDTGMFPRDALLLSWQSPKLAQLPPLADAMVRAMPRHLRLNYVFWEYLDTTTAAPIFGFTEELDAHSGMDFTALLQLYRGMMWVDYEAEGEDFRARLKAAN